MDDPQSQIGPLIKLLNCWRRSEVHTEGDLAASCYCPPCWADLTEIYKILDHLDGIKERVLQKLHSSLALTTRPASSTDLLEQERQRQEWRAQILQKSVNPIEGDSGGADNLTEPESRGQIRLRPAARQLLAPIPEEIHAYGFRVNYVELKTEGNEGGVEEADWDWEQSSERDPFAPADEYQNEQEHPEPVSQWVLPPGRVLTPGGRVRKASRARGYRPASTAAEDEDQRKKREERLQRAELRRVRAEGRAQRKQANVSTQDSAVVRPPRRPPSKKLGAGEEQSQQQPHRKKQMTNTLVNCWLSCGPAGRRSKKRKANMERLALIRERRKEKAAAAPGAEAPSPQQEVETPLETPTPIKIKEEVQAIQCHKCKRTFNSLLHYSKHRITCFRMCAVCAEPTGSAPNLHDHMLAHHPELPQVGSGTCTVCQKSYDRLERHYVTVHQTTGFSCRTCGEKCATFLEYNYHLTTHPELELPPVRCEVEGCKRLFMSYKSLLQHEANVHRREYEYRCGWPGCNYGTGQSGRLKHHVKTVHEGVKEHECHICHKSFGTASLLRGHVERHEGRAAAGKARVCMEPGCGKRFRGIGKLRDHQAAVHGIGGSNGGIAQQQHICHTCGKGFPIYNYLYIHLRSHETAEQKRERRDRAARAKEERERRVQAGLPVLAPKGRPRTRPTTVKKGGTAGNDDPGTSAMARQSVDVSTAAAEGHGNLNQNTSNPLYSFCRL